MASLLQITNAHKSYGDQILLDGADATLSDNVKVGFVGRNGAGKSTLLRILLGEEELDSGEVIRHPSLRLGYLRQHDPFLPGETALAFLMRDSEQPNWKCGEVAGQFELKGGVPRRPDRETLRRLADAREARGPASARAEPAAARRADQLPRPAHPDPARALPARLPGGVPDRLPRPGVPRRHLHPHARPVAGQVDVLPGQGRCVPGIRAGATRARRTLERRRSGQAAPPGGLHRQEQGPGQHRGAGTVEGQAAREIGDGGDRGRRTDGQYPGAAGRAAGRRGPPLPRPGDRLSRAEDRVGCPARDRSRLAGGRRRRQRPGEDDVPADGCGLAQAAGRGVRWGHGCKIGVYAQHVYTTLPESETVAEYLRSKGKGRKEQEILDVAGALLFRKSHVDKPISVLSGGERARLCLAGLLLSDYNVLILDEPGNHLDVDTVEALAEALLDYDGTVIFTSHDRHFTGRVATAVIEVRDGRVTNYGGRFDDYLYRVNKEIEAGEREAAAGKAKLPPEVAKPKVQHRAAARRGEKEIRKELKALEKTIALLDEQKRVLTIRSMESVEAAEALRIHEELEAITAQLDPAEECWLRLQAELEEAA